MGIPSFSAIWCFYCAIYHANIIAQNILFVNKEKAAWLSSISRKSETKHIFTGINETKLLAISETKPEFAS